MRVKAKRGLTLASNFSRRRARRCARSRFPTLTVPATGRNGRLMPEQDLVSWLLEQIAEDERQARLAAERSEGELWVVTGMDNAVGVDYHPERVLAECEGKRRIIEAHSAELMDVVDGVEHWTDCADCRQGPPCHTLRLLALPFADRPGYREEWRP